MENNRDLQRKNIRLALRLGALAAFLFGFTFVIAIAYNAS